MFSSEEIEKFTAVGGVEGFLMAEEFARARRDRDFNEENEGRGPSWQYMLEVTEVAYELGVADEDRWSLPSSAGNTNFWNHYIPFQADIDKLVIRLRMRAAKEQLKFSVALNPETKTEIHSLLGKVRALIEATTSLEEAKRNKLLEKLNEFAAEVDKSRTSFQAAMLASSAIFAKVEEGLKALDPARKWLDSITALLGAAKELEEAQRTIRIAYEAPRQLPPPNGKDNSGEPANPDDEIPF